MPPGERRAAVPLPDMVLASRCEAPLTAESLPNAELTTCPAFLPTGTTATAVSHTVCLYSPPGALTASRPLVLLLPWLGASTRAVDKYLALYLCHGWPVLVAESRAGHFLWPRWGRAYAAQVLGLLAEGKALGGQPLLVHALSIGGYLFAQMLLHLSKHPQDHPGVRERFRGLVYDSLVAGSVAEMARGVARMTSSVALRLLVRRGALLYFCLFRRCTVTFYEAALDVFYRPPLRCPVLIFHSHNDPLSNPRVVQQLQETWRGLGITVHVQEWQVSRHAEHLRLHPREYQQALAAFLRQLHLLPCSPRAKL
uniref:Transmembrane protein 53 n=1 Tax=Salvator merianae TaxID=96440 RepID=A0A8D0E4I1_SALMN